jgi:hypothetical protein
LRGERDEKRLQQRAIAQLMDFADAQNKQILLIVENLNMLFDEQMSAGDDWDLRHTLQNEPRLMLLGTATQRFDEIDNVDKAWFEFFALHTMEPLNLSECRQLWSNVADEDLTDNQIRPMQILTGGNPRLLQVLAGFAKGMSFRDLMANLTQLIDSHTDYFKGLLEVLPATERRVFVELLEFWKPASANQIASAARMEVSKASALLNRLLKRGAIELVEQPDKKKYYQVTERLFNIYYLMRKRGGVDDQVKVVIDFISMFYMDLSKTVRWIIREFNGLSIDDRIELCQAISYVREKVDRDGEEKSSKPLIKLLDLALKKLGLDAMRELEEVMRDLKQCIEERIMSARGSGKFSQKIVDVLIEISAQNYINNNADWVLTVLTENQKEFELEPLIVGLKIFLGEERPLVAQEIFEVGKDIADRIRSKQAELATLPRKDVEAADTN